MQEFDNNNKNEEIYFSLLRDEEKRELKANLEKGLDEVALPCSSEGFTIEELSGNDNAEKRELLDIKEDQVELLLAGKVPVMEKGKAKIGKDGKPEMRSGTKNNCFINAIRTFDTEGIFKQNGEDMTSKEIREMMSGKAKEFIKNDKDGILKFSFGFNENGLDINNFEGVGVNGNWGVFTASALLSIEKKPVTIIVLPIGSESSNQIIAAKNGVSINVEKQDLNECAESPDTYFIIYTQGHYQAVRSDKKARAVELFNEFSKYRCYGDKKKNIKAEAILHTHHSRVKTENVKNESDVEAITRFERQQNAAKKAMTRAMEMATQKLNERQKADIASRRNHNITAGVFGSVSGASGVLGGLQHFGVLSMPIPKEILFGVAVLAAVVMVIALATRPGKPKTTDKTNGSNLINVNESEQDKNLEISGL